MSQSLTRRVDVLGPTQTPERRVFLRVLGAAAATLAASACGGSPEGGTTSGGHAGGGGAGGGAGGMGGACNAAGVSVGDESLYTNIGLHQVPGGSVLIGRDSGGIYALSSICTHRGCNLNLDGALIIGGIRCTCHGSVFNFDGQVEVGPAMLALPAFAVSLSCGELWVDTSTTVPSTQRLAV